MRAKEAEWRSIMEIIRVENLVKEFKANKKKPGIKGAFINLFKPDRQKIRAVDDISFSVKKGEIVGYIGPNGAGKSTTVKMLSGILHPTSGRVSIYGISPHEDRKAVVKRLGVVFGQRTQLYWDVRLGESFELLKRVYKIDNSTYRRNMEIVNDVLKINELIDKPVRQLSLGQRMRGDLAAAVLHSPDILFLDEPTIGLDIEAKHSIRNFIRDINKLNQVTVILTTHDLDDVEQLCSRLMVINHGIIVEDGPLDVLIRKLAPHRILSVELAHPCEDVQHAHARVISQETLKVTYSFDRNEITAASLISELSSRMPIRDLSVKEPDIEETVKKLYGMDCSK